MKTIRLISLLLIIIFSGCTSNNNLILRSENLSIEIDSRGHIIKMADIGSGQNYLLKDSASPLMSVRIDKQLFLPTAADFSDRGFINLRYAGDIGAVISFQEKESHITFKLESVSDTVELIIWGPYSTTINETIGETVGVVRGSGFALGLQSLNPKTLGGYPWNENDCMPQIDIFEQDDPSDLSEEGKRGVLYRVEAARPIENGSSLQAYCRNRNTERIIENWGHEFYTAPAFNDGGVTGSSIAIFGCPDELALETIGKIEVAENLPHPMIDGEWGKTARSASAAYIILDFGEQDIDRAIEITGMAGLRYLYHSGPFASWGHFELRKEQFPTGIDGFRACVEKAGSKNIMVGVHTLSNFITTNDPYVTPVPDDRLAKTGWSLLAEGIDEKATTIIVESPVFFKQYNNNNLKTVQVGEELIRYSGVSEAEPWQLQDCQRGAYGTRVASHLKGEKISMLADHGYRVFLTDASLGAEVAANIAGFFNKTGTRQISFDGLEGNRSTGMGNYGEILFTDSWYSNINEEIKEHYIADASRTSHYFWHMYTRMNWGEPWYAGFRESQTEYRLKNQPYFKRNMMPAMLGWFRMTSSTSVEDIEWMLARSAAFNAGYAFVVDYSSLDKNGLSGDILKLLGEWEKARMDNLFSSEQKERMEDINNEFTLVPEPDGSWTLFQVYSFKFSYDKKERQPGEPLYSLFEIENPSDGQEMNFIIKAAGGALDNIKMEIDNSRDIYLDIVLEDGDCLKYSGGDRVEVYNSNWQRIDEIQIDPASLFLSRGDHKINFECSLRGGKDASARIEFRIKDTGSPVRGEL